MSSCRTWAIADGVKGLLIARRLSLVVCAFTSFAASARMWSGFGGLSRGVAGEGVVVTCVREVENWTSRMRVEVRTSLRTRRLSFESAMSAGLSQVLVG